ncbi:MAG: glycosyltransferase family 4 protein [Parcubacteria group bacterium]|nr:glycosyltransferase family 4 protein [Parcubacteria group bacterium]
MKKILYFITQSEYGGAQRYVFDLVNSLKTDFKVAVAFGEQENNLKLAKILQKNNLKYYIIPHLKRSLSPLNDLLALREIIKLIKQYQPDIIHLNSSKISILGSLAALFTNSKIENRKSKIVYTVHGWVFNEPLPAWLKYFYKYAEKFTAKFKDKIICVSEYDKQAALKNKIAPPEKLLTIHNGISRINFYSKTEAQEIINSFICHSGLEPESPPASPCGSHGGRGRVQRKNRVSGLRVKPAMTNNFIIGSIGNLYKTKGFAYLIEAADILINKNKLPITFIVIGEGSERKNLENLIEKYNLADNFILAGRIDRAAELLPAFDIYGCSSVKEGLPYAILEAMAAGLPIVSTQVGGLPEMIKHEKTGFLVKPAEARQLAEKIKLLIDDKTLGQKLGASAREKLETEFGLGKMIEKTRKLYAE